MAALDRRNLNLVDFVGLNWSCLVDRVNMLPSDAGCSAEDGNYGMHRSDTMTLERKDMDIFGHCPAHDTFYLVVCSHCGQLVKPQAFERHCERWHSAVTRLCVQSSTPASQQQLSADRPPLNIPLCAKKQKSNKDRDLSSAVSPATWHCPNNVHKETVRVSPWHSGLLPTADRSSSTSLSETACLQKSTSGGLTVSNIPQQGMRTYSRMNKNKKDHQLNKHCRVLDPEKKKLCNQESIAEDQKASGKPNTIGQLTVEKKKDSEGQDEEKHPNSFDATITSVGSNSLILRNPSKMLPKENNNNTVEVKVQLPYPFNQSLLSSEDSEEEDEEEEATDLPATPWHPKPLGLCTFGCHTLGVSIYTFDRRLHHLRFALSAMMERHVNGHLWRKMPPVSSGLRSHHVSHPTTGMSIRDGNKPCKSTAPFSHESTSLERLETKTLQQNLHINTPPYFTASPGCGSAKRGYSIVRSRKTQLMKMELMLDAKPALKANKLLNSDEGMSSIYICSHPLHRKGRSYDPSFQRPARSNCSQKKKPCLPPPVRCRKMLALGKPFPGATIHPPPTNRGTQQVIQQKLDNVYRRLAQKRKSGTKSLPLSSASRKSKYKCFSSLPCPSISSWNGEI